MPTFKEQGYDLEYYFWVGLFAPKGTPDAVITTLRDAINKAAHSKQFLDTLDNLGQELAYLDQPNSRNSGPPTPSAWKTRSTRSAACRDDTRYHRGPALRGSRLLPDAKFSTAMSPSMILRADHVAGGFFVAFGLLVFALSGDLPIGQPVDAGLRLPAEDLAVLTIFFGLVLMLRASESSVVRRR